MSKFTRKLTSSVAPIVNTPGVWTVNERTQNSTALVITSIVVCDSGYNELDDTAVGTSGGYLKIKGTGFLSTATVYLNGVLITPTVTSSLELRITVPTLTVGTYSLIVFNTAGVGAIWAAGLIISGFPVWSTTTIATSNLAVNTQLVATGDATLVYTLASGSLPPGVTLSSGGLLSGTISPVPSIDTVYNFTVDVKDAQNQNLAQAITFSLSVAYLIPKSLRFRASASAYLNRTPATAGNQKTWTISGWFKRGQLGVRQQLITVANAGPSLYFYVDFLATDVLEVFTYDSATPAYIWQLQTTQVFRDPAAWYHIVIATDTTQGTASNRVKIYVNGTQITSFAVASYPSASYDTVYNYNGASYINSYLAASSFYDGELAELNSVDGQALAPTSFGATGANSQWLPKAYTGTYGTNGFYLPFTNTTSTSTLVADSSGNANNWTPNNISLTAGSTYDSLTDVPTLTSTTVANYAVLNPLFLSTWSGGSAAVPSNANLTIQDTTIAGRNSVSTISVNSGKWYFETQSYPGGTANNNVGIAPTNIPNPATVYFFGHYSSSYPSGSIIGVVLDFTALTIKFYVANVLVQTTSIVAGDYTPIFQVSSNNGSTATMHANFGQQPFTYTAPTGFLPLNTFNI